MLIVSCDKMLSVKDSLLEIKKQEKYQICVMEVVSHSRNHSYCLAGLQYSLFAYLTFICLYPFDGLKSPLLQKCFGDLNLYEPVKSSGLVVQLKLKCLLMKPTHHDIFETKEVLHSTVF